jgi:hypothetical protein
MRKTRHGDYEKTVTFAAWMGYKIHVVFTDDMRASYFKRYGETGLMDDPCVSALYSGHETGNAHLFYSSVARAGYVAHEAWHAIHGMFEWAGVEIFDNETTAYHLGYLVGEITKFQNKVLGVKSSTKKR